MPHEPTTPGLADVMCHNSFLLLGHLPRDGRIKMKEGNLEVKGDEVDMPTSKQEKTQQHALNVIDTKIM